MIHRDRAIDLLRRANPAPPGAWLPSAEDSQRLLDVLMERSDSMETEELARVMSPPPRRPRLRRWALAAGAAAVIAAVIGAGVVLGWFEGNEQPAVVSPSPTTTVVEPTTAVVSSSTTVVPAAGVPAAPEWGNNAEVGIPAATVVAAQGVGSIVYVAAQDTWVFDLAGRAWAKRAEGSPLLNRFWSSGAYDPGSDRMMLFGGETSYWLGGRQFGDLWSYDLDSDSWEPVDVAGDRPEARRNAVMLYVDSLDRILLSGGFGADAGLSDSWLFDGDTNTWTMVTGEGAPGRDRPIGVYNSDTDQVFIYGGIGFEMGSMWIFDPGTLTWSSRPLPDGWGTCYERLWEYFEPRCGLPAVYDESRGLVLSVEGDDLLSWDPVTDLVERLSTTGADLQVRDHYLVIDPERDGLILFQGPDWEVENGGLWRLDLSTLEWRRIGPGGE